MKRLGVGLAMGYGRGETASGVRLSGVKRRGEGNLERGLRGCSWSGGCGVKRRGFRGEGVMMGGENRCWG